MAPGIHLPFLLELAWLHGPEVSLGMVVVVYCHLAMALQPLSIVKRDDTNIVIYDYLNYFSQPPPQWTNDNATNMKLLLSFGGICHQHMWGSLIINSPKIYNFQLITSFPRMIDALIKVQERFNVFKRNAPGREIFKSPPPPHRLSEQLRQLW